MNFSSMLASVNNTAYVVFDLTKLNALAVELDLTILATYIDQPTSLS